jgi:hypothetical protein
MDMNSPPDREGLEVLWRDRLQGTRLLYERATDYATDIRGRVARGEIPSPDGSFAYQESLRRERVALARYQHVLRVLTALVIDGKMPGEKDWPPPIADGDL